MCQCDDEAMEALLGHCPDLLASLVDGLPPLGRAPFAAAVAALRALLASLRGRVWAGSSASPLSVLTSIEWWWQQGARPGGARQGGGARKRRRGSGGGVADGTEAGSGGEESETEDDGEGDDDDESNGTVRVIQTLKV